MAASSRRRLQHQLGQNGPASSSEASRSRWPAGTQDGPVMLRLKMLQTMSAILQQGRQEEAGGQVQEAAGLVDPIALVQNMLGGRAGNVEVFLDNGTGNARRLTGNIGDYYFGQGLDQLIQQLADNDPNRYGTPPASKSAIDAMPAISITGEHMGTDAAHCAVCKDEFEVGMQVRQMPCKHLYHGDCILPWLTQHNSCPVCRFELPTDDPDYDRNKNGTSNENTSSSSTSPSTLEARGSTARGFSIWDTPEAPAAPTGAASTTTTAAPAAASPSMGRRGSFHFPWPFGRSSSSPPSPASPRQGQQQSETRRRSGNDGQAPSSSSNDAMKPDVLD